MSNVTFVVEPVARGWRVRIWGEVFGSKAGRYIGPYAERDEAIAEAMRASHAVEARGFEVELIVHEPPN